MCSPIQQDLADRDLLPATHLLDSGYVHADLLVSAQHDYNVDVVGPPVGSFSRQRIAGEGYDLHTFVIDWEAEQARCPEGHTSVKWTPGVIQSGDPEVRIRFDMATCRSCPARSACTWAKKGPRQLTVRPKAQHEAIWNARQRQETAEFKATYALRAGIESCLSQGTRRFEMRRSRYIDRARTHVQQILVAMAMNLVRVVAWLWNEPLGEGRRPLGHFALLAPRPLSRKALVC